jgi:hypothetical protein
VSRGPSDLKTLLVCLIAAGGPREWPANVPWPLHQAVTEHHHILCPDLVPVPAAGTGWSVPGLEAAVTELARLGRLQLREEGIASWWVADESRLLDRKWLLSCDPAVAQTVYRAARRWSALTEISAKSIRIATRSLGSQSRSGTPKRLHPLASVT